MLDLTKLEKVRALTSGIITARCPACAEVDRDHKSEHLKIWPDGHYACAANQGDGEHSRRIYAQAGVAVETRSSTHYPSRRPAITQPYEAPLPMLNSRQESIIISACENLCRSSKASEIYEMIAAKRQWKPETVRNTALDQSAGWIYFGPHIRKPDDICPDEAWCFIYPAGLKVRFDLPCGEKTFRWLKKEGLNHPSLWRSVGIQAETQTVWITEGEPDAIRLMDLGIGEDCNSTEVVCALPSASYMLRSEELSMLRSREVIFCPDNDDAGQKAASRLSKSLSTVGVQLSIRHAK